MWNNSSPAPFPELQPAHTRLRNERFSLDRVAELEQSCMILPEMARMLISILAAKANKEDALNTFSEANRFLEKLIDPYYANVLYKALSSPLEVTALENEAINIAFQKLRSAAGLLRNPSQTLDEVLQQNSRQKKEIFILQEQLTALQTERSVDNLELRHMIVPGKVIQNDARVDWDYLRHRHQFILDRPVSYYHEATMQLLDKQVKKLEGVFPSIPLMTDHSGKITFLPPRVSLDTHNERELLKVGLCSQLPVNKVLLHFYFCYFCCLPFSELKVTLRMINALADKGIFTVGEAAAKPEEFSETIPQFGRTSLLELKELFKSMGLKFSLEPADVRELYYA